MHITSGRRGSILQKPEFSRRKMITVIQQVIWPERRRTRWRFERDGVGVEGLRV